MQEDGTPVLYCAYHPDRETVLRCNRCDKPICYDCAVRTPVGYRCKECVRGQQAVYFNAHPYDLVTAAAIGLVVSAVFGALAYSLLGMFGFFSFLLALFVGPVVGGLIAEVVRRGVGRRRARYLNRVVVVAAVVGILFGGILLLSVPAIAAGAPAQFLVLALPRLVTRLDVLLFTVLVASTIYARLQ
jgi:hypothetical protein